MQSPPSRRRGLKLKNEPISKKDVLVASLAEAWIEIEYLLAVIVFYLSPPSRRRGLKLQFPVSNIWRDKSPPSRRRGLKSAIYICLATLDFGRLPRGGVD